MKHYAFRVLERLIQTHLEVHMYKKLSILFVMLLVVTAYAFAQDSSATKSDDPAAAAQGQKVTGTIQSVDTSAKKITLKQDGKTAADVYSYDDKTTFWDNKDKAVMATDLKPGAKVILQLDSMNNAISIKLAGSETH
jgi:Cu/Ag efflux protein CusF